MVEEVGEPEPAAAQHRILVGNKGNTDTWLSLAGWAPGTDQLGSCLIQGGLNAAAVGAHIETVAYAGALSKAHSAVDRAVGLPRRWLLQGGPAGGRAGGRQQAGSIRRSA